jgi:hypothetical protein
MPPGRTPRGSGRDRSGIPSDDHDGAPIDDDEEEVDDDDDDVPGLIEIRPSRPQPPRVVGPGIGFGFGGGAPPFEITMVNGQLGVRMNSNTMNSFDMGEAGSGSGPRRLPNPLAMIFQSIARGGGVGGFGGDGGGGMEEMISQIAAQLFSSGEGADEPADESFVNSLKPEPVTEADVAAQKSCSVCLVEFALEDTSVCKLACSHGFHIDCLKPWLARAHTCPVCRLELRAAQASSSSDGSGGAGTSTGSSQRSDDASSGADSRSNPDRVSGRSRARPQPEPRGDPGDEEEDPEIGGEEAEGIRRRSRRLRDPRLAGTQIDPSDILRMLFSSSMRTGGGVGVSQIRVDEDGFFEDDMEAALQQSMAEASAQQARNPEASGASGASGGDGGGGTSIPSVAPPRTQRDEEADIGRAFLESLDTMTIADLHSICLAEGVTVSPFSNRTTLIEGLAQKQGIKLPTAWSGSL